MGGLRNSEVHISESSVVRENDHNDLLRNAAEEGAEDLKKEPEIKSEVSNARWVEEVEKD